MPNVQDQFNDEPPRGTGSNRGPHEVALMRLRAPGFVLAGQCGTSTTSPSHVAGKAAAPGLTVATISSSARRT
jgi:hypothetical protein